MAGLDPNALNAIVAAAAGWTADGCRFSREHEWTREVEPGLVLVGISDYAAGELGDVVFVSVPEVGAQVTQFEKMGEIESVKAVSDLFAPVSGEVVAVNGALLQQPELVNQQAFGGGWMVAVRLAPGAGTEALLDYQGYRDYLAGLHH